MGAQVLSKDREVVNSQNRILWTSCHPSRRFTGLAEQSRLFQGSQNHILLRLS